MRTLALSLAVALLIAGPAPARAAGRVVTPDWAKQAVFYQIFPERFANGDRRNDPPGTRPWGSVPTIDNYMGGDLDGVTQHLPYLKELGVTALYFNPIFTSDSNHKYHTIDYMHVDPHFGGDAAFRRMLAAAHRQGLKVMLDGVFNHSGDSHPFFLDAAKRGPASPYWRWYQFNGFPIVKTPKPNYEAWWGLPSLPKLQVAKNPAVASYVYAVEEHWLKEGIDGWRLDVPNEIDSDAFWQGFRKRAKAINPNAYIVGEIWDPAQRWLKGDQFDSVMNYQWRDATLKFFGTDAMKASEFDARTATLRDLYDPAVTSVMFNLLDSHDTSRFLTDAGGDVSRLKLASTFQLTYPGTPCVYYGGEIGLQGGKDPDDRRCFPWGQAAWNQDLLGHYKRLIALRKANPVLATGAFRTRVADDATGVLAYTRSLDRARALVVLNNSPHLRATHVAVADQFPDGSLLQDALTGEIHGVTAGEVQLRLDPRQGMVLLPKSPGR